MGLETMRKIQVIGLPGSGKSTAINKFIKQYQGTCSYLDIADYESNKQNTKEFNCLKAANKINSNLILESATGLYGFKSHVIKLDTDIDIIKQRLLKRDQSFDSDYMSLLSIATIKADCIIKDADELVQHLLFIFQD